MGFSHISHDATVIWNKIPKLQKSILHIYTYRLSIKCYYSCPSSEPNLSATYLFPTLHYNLILLEIKLTLSLPCLRLFSRPHSRAGHLAQRTARHSPRSDAVCPSSHVLRHTKLHSACDLCSCLPRFFTHSFARNSYSPFPDLKLRELLGLTAIILLSTEPRNTSPLPPYKLGSPKFLCLLCQHTTCLANKVLNICLTFKVFCSLSCFPSWNPWIHFC